MSMFYLFMRFIWEFFFPSYFDYAVIMRNAPFQPYKTVFYSSKEYFTKL